MQRAETDRLKTTPDGYGSKCDGVPKTRVSLVTEEEKGLNAHKTCHEAIRSKRYAGLVWVDIFPQLSP